MEAVFVVYKTDSHHSYASRDIIGIATGITNACDICEAQAKKEGFKIPENDLQFLFEKMQTQGYKGEGEFQFEKLPLDTLL